MLSVGQSMLSRHACISGGPRFHHVRLHACMHACVHCILHIRWLLGWQSQPTPPRVHTPWHPVLSPLQAKSLIAWKEAPRSGAGAALADQERHILAVTHQRRLLDIVTKQCLYIIKGIMQHKVGWARGGLRAHARMHASAV